MNESYTAFRAEKMAKESDADKEARLTLQPGMLANIDQIVRGEIPGDDPDFPPDEVQADA